MSVAPQPSQLERSALLKILKAEQKIKDVKPVVHPPSRIDKIFHRCNQKRSVHYFTSGRKINEAVLQTLSEEKRPFTLPPLSLAGVPYNVIRKSEKEHLREKESKLKAADKPSRRTRFMENLAERLYVPPDDKFKLKQIKQDLDPQFYDVVKGRPIKEKFEVRKYIQNVRESLLIKLKTGYIEDEIALIDEQFRNEKNRINQICSEYKDYYSSFKEFEAHDREQWLAIRRLAEAMDARTNAMKLEVNGLMNDLSILKSPLYELEEAWRKNKLYQFFLYQISPTSWQEKHSLTAKGQEELNLGKMFNRYKLDTEGPVLSLDSLIGIFQEDTANEVENPQLYFTEPWQVRIIFREMELQHLSSLLIIEGVKKPKDIMTRGLKIVTNYYDTEISKIEEQLTAIENTIEFDAQRAKYLEDTANTLLNTDLQSLVSSEETILSHVYVEHAYEESISAGQTDLTASEGIAALKHLFEDLMMKLESLPADVVRHAEYVVKSKKTTSMERAHQAERQIAYLDGLTKSMKKALEPPFVKRGGRPLMFRSEPPPMKSKRPPPPEELTQEELDYLMYFTDYCEHEDEDVRLFLPL